HHLRSSLFPYTTLFRSNFIAQRAASRIPVVKQTDLYVVYDRGYFWRDDVVPRPLGGRPQQVGYKVEEGTYSCVEYALEHVIDDRDRKSTRLNSSHVKSS